MTSDGYGFSVNVAREFCPYSRRNIGFHLCGDAMLLGEVIAFIIEFFQLNANQS